jgi:hypothetical protein
MGETCSTDGRMRNAHSILVGRPKGKKPLGGHSVDCRIILEWISGKYVAKVWMDASGSG